MLTTGAYTFRRKARLAISLGWIGGFVDAVGFLTLGSVFVANMTGNTAILGMRLGDRLAGRTGAILTIACPILMFFAGAMISGWIATVGHRRRIKPVYAIALGGEVLLLIAFVVLRTLLTGTGGIDFFIMVSIAAMAMGLQNATITQVGGAVVRTTHVTGVLTDLGLETVAFATWFRNRTRGRWRQRIRRAFFLSRRHPSFQRLLLLGSIWGSFLGGAVLGAVGWMRFDVRCLLAPMLFLLFIISLDLMRPIADVSHIDEPAQDDELRRFGIEPSLLPREVGVFRIGEPDQPPQHAPDLGRLIDSVSNHYRIVMLLLEGHLQVDDNNLAGLADAVSSMREQECDLVLCVRDRGLYMRIRRGRLGEELGRLNVCPDPEFAVARAVELSS